MRAVGLSINRSNSPENATPESGGSAALGQRHIFRAIPPEYTRASEIPLSVHRRSRHGQILHKIQDKNFKNFGLLPKIRQEIEKSFREILM
jgi:hypothetical protein